MSRLLQTTVFMHGVRTELVVQPFADRILVLVTQMGKVGNLIQASIPSTTTCTSHDASNLQGSLPPPSPAIQLTTIFGSAPSAHMQTLYSLYASQIATVVWLTIRGGPQSVIVGIALQASKRHDIGEERQTFHAVMDALRTILLQDE